MDTSTSQGLSRRSFIAGAVAASAVVAGSTTLAHADDVIEGSEVSTTVGLFPWLGEPAIADSITEVIDVDLVIVGAGNGGMTAAVTAQQEGANVLVLEKTNSTQPSRQAISAINSKLYNDGEKVVDVPLFINELSRYESGGINMPLVKKFCDTSGEMIEWLAGTLAPKGFEMPLEWYIPEQVAASSYHPPVAYNPVIDYNPDGPNPGTYQHVAALAEIFQENGGTIMFETPAAYLLQDADGNVTGIVAMSEEKGAIQVNAAKGVILCTGGYAANQDMLDFFVPVASHACVMNSGRNEDGSGIKMAMWAGGILEQGNAVQIWDRGLMYDDTVFGPEYGSGRVCIYGSQPFLRVNARGERFMNEDQEYPLKFSAGLNQPGRFAWQVWDSSYWEDMVQFDVGGCARIVPTPSGGALNADVYNTNALTKENVDEYWFAPDIEKGGIKVCDTLEELAAAMGMEGADAETFLSTVAHYNELVAGGADDDFGKPAYRLSAIDEPPYYAAKFAGALLTSINGIVTDVNSQPLREDGTVIGGLYVNGNDQGGFFPRNWPSQFPGIAAGKAYTLARQSVLHALGIKK